jgi:acetylornithine deacetylase/succinyl-diaminopimelate desuccinylase-like protein
MPGASTSVLKQLQSLVSRERIVRDTLELCGLHSPTGAARPALDRLADMLTRDGFSVERPEAGYPAAPAVACRWTASQPGPVVQFNGHLDTVHLPFVPPQLDGERITGTGSCDMKGGTVAMLEALRVLRDSGLLRRGGILLTAHDLHEAPWGDGHQLEDLIRGGYCGDAVLIPEYLNSVLPVVGRGLATWRVTIRRSGPPVHEVLRPASEPSVIDAAAELVARLRQYGGFLASKSDPVAGTETVFVGQLHAGEIFNQYPQVCWLEGTRRWLPGEDREVVEQEFRGLLQQVAQRTRTQVELRWQVVRDGFRLDTGHAFVQIFRDLCGQSRPEPLPEGNKPFCDDCNAFWSLKGIPAITHGPSAGGAHTVEEWVSIADQERIAALYAATALEFCHAG